MYRDIAGHEDLTAKIIECGIKVHETFGPGRRSGAEVFRPAAMRGTQLVRLAAALSSAACRDEP